MAAPGRVSLVEDGLVYWVILRRPEKLNALDRLMWLELASALGSACSSDARLVALRGEGRALCTGDDIAAMYRLSTRDEADEFFAAVEGAVKELARCEKPVAVLVKGYAYGGCAEILLLSDYVVAVRGSLIAFPEVLLGLIPPLALAVGTRLLGRRLLRHLESGAPLTAEEAADLGLVDDLVDTEREAEERIRAFAEQLSRADAGAVAFVRRTALSQALEGGLAGPLEKLKELVLSEAAKDRMRAFLESRQRRRS